MIKAQVISSFIKNILQCLIEGFDSVIKLIANLGVINYIIEISNKYSYIQGDSANGKTNLYESILMFESGEEIDIRSDLPVHALDRRATAITSEYINSLIFIDEDCRILEQDNCASEFKNSNNYKIII